jgi:hypothetical protein
MRRFGLVPRGTWPVSGGDPDFTAKAAEGRIASAAVLDDQDSGAARS